MSTSPSRVAFTVTFKAVSESVGYAASDFYVRGSTGVHYSFDSTSSLDSGVLHAGEQATVRTVVAVPTPHGTLVYQPNSQVGSLVEWPF